MQVLLANPGILQHGGIVVPHLHQPVFNALSNQMVGQNVGQQEFLETQQMFLANRDHQHQQQQQQQHVMLRSYEQQEFMKFNNGVFEPSVGGGFGNQAEEFLSPSLALGNFENVESYQMQQQGEQHHPIEAQLLLSPQQESQGQHQQQQCASEDGRNVVPA